MADRNILVGKYDRLDLACPWHHGSHLCDCRVCHFFKGIGGEFGSGVWVVCAWTKEEAAELDEKQRAEIAEKRKAGREKRKEGVNQHV